MKRSEMLKLMMDAALKTPYHDDGGLQRQMEVELILRAIEEAGMVPPSYTERMSCGCCSSYQEGSWEKE